MKLTIVVHARAIKGTYDDGSPIKEFCYHASFKEPCGISHWHSRGTVKSEAINRAREVAKESGYETADEIELIEVE